MDVFFPTFSSKSLGVSLPLSSKRDIVSKELNHCGLSTSEYIFAHDQIVQSGLYNFEFCRFPLNSKIRVDFFKFMLSDYIDKNVCQFLEFGFPIGYSGRQQANSSTIVPFCKNHSGAKQFPKDMQKYFLKEKSYGAVLGPFKQNLFSRVV